MVGWAAGESLHKSILGVQERNQNTSFGKDELRLVLFVFGKRGFERRMSGSSSLPDRTITMVPCENASAGGMVRGCSGILGFI